MDAQSHTLLICGHISEFESSVLQHDFMEDQTHDLIAMKALALLMPLPRVVVQRTFFFVFNHPFRYDSSVHSNLLIINTYNSYSY